MVFSHQRGRRGARALSPPRRFLDRREMLPPAVRGQWPKRAVWPKNGRKPPGRGIGDPEPREPPEVIPPGPPPPRVAALYAPGETPGLRGARPTFPHTKST